MVFVTTDTYMVAYGFYDNHSAIHNQAKINGSQTHKVSADTKQPHHTKSKQHSERNDGCHHQSCPIITQKQNEYEHNNEATLDKVAGDSASNTVNQLSTVNEWFYDYTLWQTLLNLRNTLFYVLNNLLEIFTFQHQ